VLGAGASVTSGLPDWEELIRRVAAASEFQGRPVPFAALKAEGYSLPIIASLIEERCPPRGTTRPRENFIELVRDALYREFRFYREGLTERNARDFVQFIARGNSTLRAVASLCVSREGKRFRPNRRVRGVVTFNLDSLLQAYVRQRYGRKVLRTIDRSSADTSPRTINVYHVHGFLRFDQHARNPTKEAADQSVLTEQDYFDFFNDPTSLFNYAFLHLLREYSCLFIGLGLRDDNLRRLLHLSKQERMASLKAEGVPEQDRRRRTMRHFAMLEKPSSLSLKLAVEESLAPLGTRVLWLASFDEIPKRLGALYESAGGKWADVDEFTT